MANRLQHFDSIHIIKCVLCINKLKAPIILSRVSVPNRLNPIYFPIDYRLQSCLELVILACVVTSGPVTFSMHLSKIRRHISWRHQDVRRVAYPMQSDRLPQMPNRRPMVENSALIRGFLLCSSNFSSHPCKSFESVIPSPAFPESFCGTKSTTYSAISTGIKTGVSSYTSNVKQWGFLSAGCFPSRTYAAVFVRKARTNRRLFVG